MAGERKALAEALRPLPREHADALVEWLAARGWRLVPEPLPREALDVERLARAIWEDDDHSLGDVAAYHAEAARIAREYAALSPDRPTPP